MSELELHLNEDELGAEYIKALKDVIDIRADRRKIYGDIFLDETILSLSHTIDGKRKRFDYIYAKNEILNEMDSMKTQDDIIDIINYYLFILCLLKNRK